MPSEAIQQSTMAPEFGGRDFVTPEHVAIIMDGNGRWAEARGLQRSQGHRKGVEAVRAAVRAAGELGVKTLTLFSFSSENWSRPEQEVSDLMGLLKIFIRRDLADLHRENVRVSIIGAKENIPADILPLLEEAENLTRNNTATRLVIAFNYGSRNEIVRATQTIAQRVAEGLLAVEDITADTVSASLDTADWSDPDVIIRTSGEMRLSNFLLWQAAYSEFVFLDCLWPDFDKSQFEAALSEFHGRTRRYGGVITQGSAMKAGA